MSKTDDMSSDFESGRVDMDMAESSMADEMRACVASIVIIADM